MCVAGGTGVQSSDCGGVHSRGRERARAAEVPRAAGLRDSGAHAAFASMGPVVLARPHLILIRQAARRRRGRRERRANLDSWSRHRPRRPRRRHPAPPRTSRATGESRRRRRRAGASAPCPPPFRRLRSHVVARSYCLVVVDGTKRFVPLGRSLRGATSQTWRRRLWRRMPARRAVTRSRARRPSERTSLARFMLAEDTPRL